MYIQCMYTYPLHSCILAQCMTVALITLYNKSIINGDYLFSRGTTTCIHLTKLLYTIVFSVLYIYTTCIIPSMIITMICMYLMDHCHNINTTGAIYYAQKTTTTICVCLIYLKATFVYLVSLALLILPFYLMHNFLKP